MNRFDLTGHTLGQYTVMDRLGRGGMADVYKAFHPQLEVYRAIKVIRPEFVTTDDFQARFQLEAQAVAALRHPNIVQVQDFGELDDIYYMVMEFVQGRDLKQIVQDEGQIRPIRRAVNIVSQIADALHYAHSRGLIHRDIKPENVMINQDGLPILMDFGISKLLTVNTQLTRTGLSIGTPAYMAPEQAKAEPEIGPPADIYSLSIVLYEMLTGRLPFSADTPLAAMLKAINDPLPLPRNFSADVSESLQQVLVKGTAKDVNNRYATALQFQAALQRALEEEPDSVQDAATELFRAPEPPEKTPLQAQAAVPSERRIAPLLIVLTMVALLIAAGAYFFIQLEPGTGKAARSADEQNRPTDTAATAVDPGEPDADQPPDAAAPKAIAAPQLTDAAPGPSTQPAVDTAAPFEVTPGGESQSIGTTPDATTPPTVEEDVPAVQKEVAQVLEQSRKIIEQRAATQPSQALEFPLDGEQDEVLYLQVHAASATTDFKLIAPDGRNEVFKHHTSHGPVTLPQSGRYLLSALTRGKKTAEIDFTVWRLEPPVIDGGEIEPGRYVKGATTVPGQQVRYRFEGSTGQTLFFDHSASSATTDFSLVAPGGRSVLFKNHADAGPLQLKQAGTYTLTADPRNDKTTEFEFAMWHVEPPVIDGGEIEPGRYVKGATTVPGQQVRYRFEGSTGQTLFFDHSASSATTDFSLVAPDGRSVLFKNHADAGPLQLKQAGTYTLTADPRNDKTTEFEFAMWHVEPPVIDGGEIEPGRYVKGATTVPGQQVRYRFEGSTGQTLFFDHSASSATTDFSLVAPDGRSVLFKNHADAGPLQLKQTGTYTLTADPRNDKTTEFEFAMWHVEPPVIDGGEIEPGRYVKGATTVPGQQVRYRFEGSTGQTLFFDHSASSATTDFSLVAPDGRSVLFKNHADAGPLQLKQAGTYTLTADPRNDKTTEFEFELRVDP